LDKLRATIIKLREKVTILETEIITIKESETLKMIQSITDWNEYFNRMKEKLLREFELLKIEIQT
jgi:hypothetical protein